MTPLGRELRSLARQIADQASQAGDIEQQQMLRRELERKLAEAGGTMKETAKAAGVSRLTVYAWSRQAHKGRYPTL